MSTFEDPFINEYHFVGVLKVADNIVANAKVDIRFSEYDTNDISVRISDIKWLKDVADPCLQSFKHKRLDFYCEISDSSSIRLKLNSDYYLPFDYSETTASEYQKHEEYQDIGSNPDSTIAEAVVSYIFPLTGLIAYLHGCSFFEDKGYVRGWPLDDRNENIKWYDDSIHIQTKDGEFTFYDFMTKKDIKNDNIHHGIVIGRRSKVFWSIRNEGASLEEIEKRARSSIRPVFMILSLLEGDAIHWKIEKIFFVDNNGYTVKSRTTYRWAMPPGEDNLVMSRARQYKKDLRKLFPELINAYAALDISVQKIFDEAMNAYQLACRAKVLEVALIYWHACLDLLKKHYGFGGKPFSKNLLLACKNTNIDIADLDLKMSATIPDKLRFNEIRDKYLHDGFLVDDYEEIISETRKIKALTERLIVKLLGIDCKLTKLGIPYP